MISNIPENLTVICEMYLRNKDETQKVRFYNAQFKLISLNRMVSKLYSAGHTSLVEHAGFWRFTNEFVRK